MAENYSFRVDGQPYWECQNEREIDVFFSVPDDKVLQEKGAPGICLLIAGCGADSSANVFKKMRNVFADKYNLVVVQCDYFGHEFMDKRLVNDFEAVSERISSAYTPEQLAEICRDGASIKLTSDICDAECRENFCEMGLFQALDSIRAVKSVMEMMDEIGLNYRPNIMCYGVSHGGYLSYVINALYPCLIANVIDNSAWIFPVYMNEPRVAYKILPGCDDSMLALVQEFHAKEYIKDKEIYDLRLLYAQFENRAHILSFHGTDDALISLETKKEFLREIRNVDLNVVGEREVDGNIFTSTGHGLGIDFLKLFDHVMEKKQLAVNHNADKMWEANEFRTSLYRYYCTLEDGMPTIHREKI